MKRIFFAFFMFCLFFGFSGLETQAMTLKNFESYGFFSATRFVAVEHDSTDTIMDWARVGVTGAIINLNSKVVDSVGFKVEYDVVSNKLKFGYAQLYRHMLGGRGSFMFGYNATAGINAYSGPRNIWLKDWPAAFYGYTTFVPGVTFLYERSILGVPFLIRLASFAKNQLGALIVWGPLNAYCEEQIGHGVVVNVADGRIFNWQPDIIWSPMWFHPNIGWSRYYAGVAHPHTLVSELHEDRDVFYVQNYIKLGQSVRAYSQYEWGDMPVTWLVGITGEYFKLQKNSNSSKVEQ